MGNVRIQHVPFCSACGHTILEFATNKLIEFGNGLHMCDSCILDRCLALLCADHVIGRRHLNISETLHRFQGCPLTGLDFLKRLVGPEAPENMVVDALRSITAPALFQQIVRQIIVVTNEQAVAEPT